MGWIGGRFNEDSFFTDRTNVTQREAIKNYIRGIYASSKDVELMDLHVVGKEAYVALKFTSEKEGSLKQGDIFAEVVLVELRQKGWIYVKTMTEHEGPLYYKCPKRILDILTPVESSYANEWRGKCLQTIKQKSEVSNRKRQLKKMYTRQIPSCLL